MKICKLFFFLVCVIDMSSCYSQTGEKKIHCKDDAMVHDGTKLSCIQGIFSPIDDENPNLKTYWINKGFKTLTVVINEVNGIQDTYSFSTGYNGFYNFQEYASNFSSYAVVDSFYVCNLSDDGPHYIEFFDKDIKSNGWVSELTTQPEFFCEEGSIETSDRNLTRYSKQSFLPYSAYHALEGKGKEDQRNYIHEFDIKPKTGVIIVDKAYFYNDSNDQSKRKAFVLKDDTVFIETIQPTWIQVAYVGEKVTTKGWLKRNSIKIQ